MQVFNRSPRVGSRTTAARRIRALGQLTATLAFAFVAACSDKNDPVIPTETKAITLSLSGNAVSGTPGSAPTVTAFVARTGGFTGDVTLAAEGLPTGVTAAFAPATLGSGVTSSVMTLTVGATAAAGNSTITIRATGSGVTAQTSTVTLTITVPSITLTTGSAALSVPQGQTGTAALTLERLGGFQGAVTLAAEGLPAGVTATFNPANIGAGVTSSTLTLNVGSGVVVGAYNVTVRATGTGVTDKTAVIALTITAASAPDFTLTATPAALSVAPGGNAQTTIAMARTGGFNGAVTFTTSTLPTGVTATFTPNATTTNQSTLAFTTTAAAAPGQYTITVTGAATGQTSRTVNVVLTITAPASITLALAPTAGSVVAGAATQSNITLTRNGGLTGDITLTAEGAPAGVTVTFTPSTVSGTTSSANFATTGAVAPGTYNINVKATGTGAVTTTQAFALTVTAVQGYTVAFTSANATIAAGGTGTLTANITRTGGFAGAVNFTVGGLPAGITSSVNPAAATGASATVNLTVAGSVAAGTYNGTLTGTGTGVTGSTTPFTVTVTGGGGGAGNVQWVFCDASRVPLFFAFRDGSTGAWTRVTPTGNTFAFNINQSVGGVAYVLPSGTGFATTVFLQTAAELTASASSECVSFPTGGKTVNGTVTGLTLAQSAAISLGSASASASFSSPPFTLTNVPTGLRDLLASRTSVNLTTGSFEIDRLFIRRGLNPANNSLLDPIDFASAEGFAPASATLTISGSNGEQLFTSTSFQTANGSSISVLGGLPSTNATRTLLGVPTGRLAAGDLHLLLTNATNGDASSIRGTYTYFREVASRTIDLGPAVTAPATTSSTNVILRPRVQGNFETDYSGALGVSFFQNNNRSVTVTATKGYFGAATAYVLEAPDIGALAGYQATWGLTPSTATTYTFTASGQTQAAPTEGTAYRYASRVGSVPN